MPGTSSWADLEIELEWVVDLRRSSTRLRF